MQRPELATQCRGRPLTAAETALAAALEQIFSQGTHAFDAVAAALQSRGVAPPGGGDGDWTVDLLERELRAINASLDDSYARDGIGA